MTQLPILVTESGVSYYVDDRLTELRCVDNPHDVIPMNSLTKRLSETDISNLVDILSEIRRC